MIGFLYPLAYCAFAVGIGLKYVKDRRYKALGELFQAAGLSLWAGLGLPPHTVIRVFLILGFLINALNVSSELYANRDPEMRKWKWFTLFVSAIGTAVYIVKYTK